MLCKQDLNILKKNLISDWENYLKKYGVKLPDDGQRLFGILCLYENLGTPLTQDEMIQWFQKRKLPEYDRQIRHIADAGWYIIGGNSRSTRYEIHPNYTRDQICLKTIEEPNPIWTLGNLKRQNFLDASEWKDILEVFKNRGCAVCGIKYNNYDKGHLLLNRPYEKNNIVPMCTSCNNWGQMYNLEFTLDNNLRARPLIKK